MNVLLEESSPRRVLDCGRNAPGNYLHPDRNLSFHDLIYMIKGEWEIWQDDASYLMKKGDVLLLSAGHHHFGRVKSSPDAQTYYIHFEASPEDRLTEEAEGIAAGGFYRFRMFDGFPNDSEVGGAFSRVIASYWLRSAHSASRAEHCLSLLLCELSDRAAALSGGRITEKDTDIVKLLVRIAHNSDRFYSIDELASFINVSRKRLCNEFKRVTGETAHRYQVRRKLTLADETIQKRPDVTLKELAASLGFCDEYHFAKCYKAYYRHPPKQH